MSAFIALGSNLGDPLGHLRRALREVAEFGTVTGRSSLYATAPVGGPPGQPEYLNAVVRLEPRPDLTDPHALLAALLSVEARHGRVRRQRWAERTLDLDVLDISGLTLSAPDLALPHPRMMERAFVLTPLCELAPDWAHPVSRERACAALERLSQGGVRRTALEW